MMTDLLQKGSTYFRQGRCFQAEKLLNQISLSEKEFLPSRCLLLRCLIEQGKIGQAGNYAEELEQTFFLDLQAVDRNANEEMIELHLWIYFIKLYSQMDWKKLQFLVENVLGGNSSAKIKALALDLRTRGEIFASVLAGVLPSQQSQQKADQFDAVIKAYREAGLIEEALYSKFRQAVFCCGRRRNLAPRAYKLFSEIIPEATEASNLTLVADSNLYLAELEFINVHDDPQSMPDYLELAKKFEKVASLFQTAKHPLAEEKVALRFGLLLLEYGLEEGVKFITDSFPKIEENENYILIQEGWRQLMLWHTYHGNLAQLKAAQAELNSLNEKMKFNLSASVDALGEGDSAFRKGEVTAAFEFLRQNSSGEQSALLTASSRFISATVMNSVGLIEETRRELEEVIRILEEKGGFQLISEAWMMYALTFMNENLPKSIECLTNAIKADEKLNDSPNIGRNYTLRAWLKALNNYRQKIFPIVTKDVEADFDHALEKLQPLRTLEGRNALISLCQMRGQSACMEKNWQDCGHWLTQAEELAGALKLHPQTAFSIIYQGLALIEIARSAGAEDYKPAMERFRRGEEIFVGAGIDGQVWRTLFYQGLCEYEAGERTDSGSEIRTERFNNANTLLKKAVEQINDLRGLASSDEILKSYKINLSIGADKQEVYRTGFQLNWRYRNDSAEAFWWLEQMKARALIKALTRKLPPADDLLGNELVKKDLELQESLQRESDSTKRADLRKRQDQILTKLEKSPATTAYSALRRGEPVNWSGFRQYLLAQQEKLGNRRMVVAEFYCSAHYSILMTMRADWESPTYELLPIDYKNLHEFVNRHFYRKNGVRYMLEDIGEEQWQSFSSLITPVFLHSSPGDVVCLIPNGILHNLPLHTLEFKGQRLIERNPVFYSPSASLLNYISYKPRLTPSPASKGKRIRVFGNSTGNLKFAEEEAKAVAKKFRTKAKLKDEVTGKAFSEALLHSEIIHFAGHGELASSDGFQSRLFLARDDSLTAADILDFSIQNELVVLSGCETGLSVYNTGDELTGLASSFLSAGAKSLIVTQWRVDDESSMALLTEFYRIWLGRKKTTRVDALQSAMINIRKNPQWQSFYYWGGFVLYGNWD